MYGRLLFPSGVDMEVFTKRNIDMEVFTERNIEMEVFTKRNILRLIDPE